LDRGEEEGSSLGFLAAVLSGNRGLRFRGYGFKSANYLVGKMALKIERGK